MNRAMRFKVILAMVLFGLFSCKSSDFSGSVPRKAAPPESNVREFTQAAFPVGSKSYVQGTQGDQAQDDFEQGKWGDLDLLVVIDNSLSMAEEQANLSERMAPLLSHLEKSEWQIGVITTDPSDSYVSLVSKGDRGASGKFKVAIEAGTSGTGCEAGIYQAVKGLKKSGGWFGRGWVRDGSTVAVLIVSDEDNCAFEHNAKKTEANPPPYGNKEGCSGSDLNGSSLVNYLSSIRTIGKDAKVYGLIWHPSHSVFSQCSTGFTKGPTYARVISETGGTWGTICSNDYSSTLQRISKDISQELKYEFPLAFTPESGTLQVLVDGQPWPHHELQGDVIKFTKPPPFGSQVKVTYKHGKEGNLWSTFPLDGQVVPGTIAVKVDGRVVNPSEYSYDEDFNRIKFNRPPADRANVTIEYKEATRLDTDFEIGRGRQDVQVEVNGKRVRDFKYDSDAGVVTIMPPPREGAQIRITFKKPNG